MYCHACKCITCISYVSYASIYGIYTKVHAFLSPGNVMEPRCRISVYVCIHTNASTLFLKFVVTCIQQYACLSANMICGVFFCETSKVLATQFFSDLFLIFRFRLRFLPFIQTTQLYTQLYILVWNVTYRQSNNRGPRSSFQRFLVPVYLGQPSEKLDIDPSLYWEWQ